ncbi:hypothetical protein AB0M50_00700 [Nonomuraea fuscirosea]|uniref:hypothetical protein n=1 Tax=Nonomuraea fuscirosea TaxID=1291556 RepID=UPI003425212D
MDAIFRLRLLHDFSVELDADQGVDRQQIACGHRGGAEPAREPGRVRLLVTDQRLTRNPVYGGPRDAVVKE